MITIRLINDNELSATDFSYVCQAIKYFVPLVTKAWNLPPVTVATGQTIQTGDWVVYITEKNRVAGATGYHDNVNGVPTAYCSLPITHNPLLSSC